MLSNQSTPQLQPGFISSLYSDQKAKDTIREAVETTVRSIWGDYEAGMPSTYIGRRMVDGATDAVRSALLLSNIPFEAKESGQQYQNTYIGSEYNVVTKFVVLRGRLKKKKVKTTFKVAPKGPVTKEYITYNLALRLPFVEGALHQPVITEHNHNYFIFWDIFKKVLNCAETGEQKEYDFVRIALVLAEGISNNGGTVYCSEDWILGEYELGPSKQKMKTKKPSNLPQPADISIPSLEHIG